MSRKFCGDYLTNREWFEDVLGDEKVVLCWRSALECLSLFSGYIYNSEIEVYSLKKGDKENVNYHILNEVDFHNLEIVHVGTLRCTSINQTFNDMMANYDDIDDQSLVEALSKYYFINQESFQGLSIKEGNQEIFDSLKEWAMEYYSGG